MAAVIPPTKDLWPLLKQTGSDWLEDKAPKLAASLALYAMLSLAPMLVILIKVVGMVYGDEAHKVEEAMQSVMPGTSAAAVKEMVVAAGKEGSGFWATIFSVLIAAFGATGVFGELQDSMNTIWEVKPKPNQGIWGFVRTRFLSLAMVLGLAFLLMVSTVGTTLITTIGGKLSGGSQVIGYILSTVASLGIMTVLFAAIFKLLPDAEVKWRDVLFGAIVTAVLFEIGKHVLSWYLKGATEVYGAAASFAAILLWIYYSAQILFLGAELTQAYASRYGTGIQPSEHAEPMTAEARAQQGMRPKPDDRAAQQQGGRRQAPQPAAGRQPGPVPPGYVPASARARVVTVEQPANPTRQNYLIAAAGAVAAAMFGAGGFAGGKKVATRSQLRAIEVNERLETIERRLGRGKELEKNAKEFILAERISRIEQHVEEASKRLRRRQTAATVREAAHVTMEEARVTAREQAGRLRAEAEELRRRATADVPPPRWAQRLAEFIAPK